MLMLSLALAVLPAAAAAGPDAKHIRGWVWIFRAKRWA